MIKKFLFIVIVIVSSCQPVVSNYNPETDSTAIVSQDTTSAVKNLRNRDSLLANCPVKIISTSPVEHDEYSNYKDVHSVWKNVSKKTISAIRFRWTGINAFGEPADMGSSTGIGAGFTDDILRSGKSDNGTWEILSKDLKKITKAWVYEVAFEDGTKWESNE